MNKALRTVARHLALGCALLTAAGCLGPGPKLAYLRLSPQRELLCPPATAETGSEGTGIAVREVTSLPALERQAVLFANGPVLTPSATLAFEGTPAELTRNAIAEALRCSPGLTQVSADSPRHRPPLEARVRVAAFEVQGDQHVFRVALDAEIADTALGRTIGFKNFKAQAPVGDASARMLALAAEEALGRAVGELAGWLAVTAAAR